MPTLPSCILPGDAQEILLNLADSRTLHSTWASDMLTTTIDGVNLVLPTAVYAGPQVQLADGVLTIRNGDARYRIDWSGDEPVFWAARK